jgi:hypothetical protein
MDKTALRQHSNLTLEETIKYLKSYKIIFTDDVYTGATLEVSLIFNMDQSEVENLVNA